VAKIRRKDGEKQNGYRFLVGKREGNRSLRRHRCRWKDNIMTDIEEIG
jgi:hypothetical protein